MISLIGHEPAYFGKSTDDKPTDVGVNTVFIELDSGLIYFFDDDDTWKEVGNVEPSQVSTLSASPSVSSGISPVIRPSVGLGMVAPEHVEDGEDMEDGEDVEENEEEAEEENEEE